MPFWLPGTQPVLAHILAMAGRNHLKLSGIIAWNVLNCREPFSVPLTDFSSDPDFYQVPITVLGHISRDTDRMTSKFQIMHSVMSLTARWHFHWIGIIGNNLYQVPICVQGHKYIGMIFFLFLGSNIHVIQVHVTVYIRSVRSIHVQS